MAAGLGDDSEDDEEHEMTRFASAGVSRAGFGPLVLRAPATPTEGDGLGCSFGPETPPLLESGSGAANAYREKEMR